MKQAFLALLFVATTIAFSFNPQGQPKHQRMMDDLKLTDAQQEQFKKISFDTQKKQIEVRAKVQSTQLDLRQLMTAKTIDKSAIEKKFNEIAALQTSMKMNHLNGWTEKNKVLNADQQVTWKKTLTMKANKSRNMNMRGMRHKQNRDNVPGRGERPRRMMREHMPPGTMN